MDRRSYIKSVGGTAAALSVAGCSGDGGGDEATEETTDDATEGGSPAESETATEAVTTVTPGTAPGFPPFEMKEGGELVGFDVDLLSAVVAEAEGYELGEWQEFDFDSLTPALTGNNIDVIAAAMTINDERDETIDFTNPYYDANQAVLVREGGDFQPGSVEDLADRPIGAQSGTTGADQMQMLVDDGTISSSQATTYGNYVLAVEDLTNGNTDAVIVDTPVAETFVSNRNVVIAFTIQTGEEYGFGVRENASELQTALNDGLAAVREDGTYDNLTEKWFASE